MLPHTSLIGLRSGDSARQSSAVLCMHYSRRGSWASGAKSRAWSSHWMLSGFTWRDPSWLRVDAQPVHRLLTMMGIVVLKHDASNILQYVELSKRADPWNGTKWVVPRTDMQHQICTFAGCFALGRKLRPHLLFEWSSGSQSPRLSGQLLLPTKQEPSENLPWKVLSSAEIQSVNVFFSQHVRAELFNLLVCRINWQYLADFISIPSILSQTLTWQELTAIPFPNDCLLIQEGVNESETQALTTASHNGNGLKYVILVVHRNNTRVRGCEP